jgi:hypothetical protein
MSRGTILIVSLAVALPSLARAQSGDESVATSSVPEDATTQTEAASSPAAPADAPAEASTSLGLAVDLGVSSVYVFRGYNMFQTKSQWDQHPFLAPGLTYTPPAVKGLSIGYWGAYQFAGGNVKQAMDSGLGAENDLIVNHSRSLVGDLAGGLGFIAYIYPLADKKVAGTSVPVYLEPAVFASLPTVVDLGLRVSYYHGLQKAISAYRYVYVNPTLGKTRALTDTVSLALSGSLGYKLFIDHSTPTAKFNTLDALMSAALPIVVAGPFYVKPSVSWAWTNFPDRSTSDEMVIFGGVNLGANL